MIEIGNKICVWQTADLAILISYRYKLVAPGSARGIVFLLMRWNGGDLHYRLLSDG